VSRVGDQADVGPDRRQVHPKRIDDGDAKSQSNG
jgi:hypothetical protein